MPKRFASASELTVDAAPLFDDLPRRVRVIAAWGERGAVEPGLDTPVTLLGTDGRWRKLTARDIGRKLGYLVPGVGTLAPDGSKWVVSTAGSNKLLDFRTGKLEQLQVGSDTRLVAWSEDSERFATWSVSQGGLSVFDRDGRPLGVLPLRVAKRSVYMTPDYHVAVVGVPGRSGEFTLSVFSPDGRRTYQQSCKLGRLGGATVVDGFDGESIWLRTLTDPALGSVRLTKLDVDTGATIFDVVHTGWTPYFDSRVEPDIYISGISASRTAIYSLNPRSGQVEMITKTEAYKQSGYENHASDIYASQLIFDDSDG